jgi:hypothetical protein
VASREHLVALLTSGEWPGQVEDASATADDAAASAPAAAAASEQAAA